jgi:signal peptidase I
VKIIKTTMKWLENTLLGMLVIIAVFSVFSFVKSKKNPNYILGMASYKFMAVLSGSMSPTFNVYDLIVDKEVSPKDIHLGDVITFREGDVLITHRVIKMEEKEGKKFFVTRGDANDVEDYNPVTSEQVQAKYLFRIPYMGLVLSKIRGAVGIGIVWAAFILFAMLELMPEFKKENVKDDPNYEEEY